MLHISLASILLLIFGPQNMNILKYSQYLDFPTYFKYFLLNISILILNWFSIDNYQMSSFQNFLEFMFFWGLFVFKTVTYFHFVYNFRNIQFKVPITLASASAKPEVILVVGAICLCSLVIEISFLFWVTYSSTKVFLGLDFFWSVLICIYVHPITSGRLLAIIFSNASSAPFLSILSWNSDSMNILTLWCPLISLLCVVSLYPSFVLLVTSSYLKFYKSLIRCFFIPLSHL